MPDSVRMANTLEFLRGVDRLHAFYTENVRMLAHAYDLSDEEASRLLAHTGFANVSVAILREPRVDLLAGLGASVEDEVHTHPVVDDASAPTEEPPASGGADDPEEPPAGSAPADPDDGAR